MEINFKFFEVNFIASLAMIVMLFTRLGAEYYELTVLYNWATVTMYISMVVGGFSVILGMCDGALKATKEWVKKVLRRFERA